MKENRRRPMVAGNWKMQGSPASISALLGAIGSAARSFSTIDIAVFPPFIFVESVARQLADTGIAWGAQNVSTETAGAYTGEIAASMLRDMACRYVLIGHSERRALFNETDAIIAKKWITAKAAGLTPILCVGETRAERDAGDTTAIITRQLSAIFDIKSGFQNALVAYEPVWAIGTGLTATPEQAESVHATIRQLIAEREQPAISAALRILYGGSVNAENAQALFSMPNVDGGLVGGASLNAEAFLRICSAASEKYPVGV